MSPSSIIKSSSSAAAASNNKHVDTKRHQMRFPGYSRISPSPIMMMMNKMSDFWVFFFLSITLLINTGVRTDQANVVSLTNQDFDAYTSRYELVFLNFYADWCHFSQMLAPMFAEVAKKITLEFPDENKVLFAKIDCEKENVLAHRFHITKYPTLKVMVNGKLHRREYRGQRTVDGLAEFLRNLLKDPVIPVNSYEELANKVDEKKGAIVAYFRSDAGFRKLEYDLFRKVARDLKGDCNFYWVTGPPVDRHIGDPGKILAIKFKRPRSHATMDDLVFPTELKSYDELSTWATDKCIPLVREITFENAEELTEEGLPFLILFHHPDDKESVDLFTKVVNQELLSESGNVNFLLADGIKFAHPLMHLGKTNKDLPLIAIDSFRHMYMFPRFEDIRKPGALKTFVQDLYSGKLHREFHFGPDSNQIGHDQHQHQQHQQDQGGNGGGGPTLPPESTFAKLAPSRNRYTILKDEL